MDSFKLWKLISFLDLEQSYRIDVIYRFSQA